MFIYENTDINWQRCLVVMKRNDTDFKKKVENGADWKLNDSILNLEDFDEPKCLK